MQVYYNQILHPDLRLTKLLSKILRNIHNITLNCPELSKTNEIEKTELEKKG